MRKAVSILLSVVLLVCSISVVFTLQAGADAPMATNLLANGDLTNVSNFSTLNNTFGVSGFIGYHNGTGSSVALGTANDLPAGVKSNNNVVNFTLNSSTTKSNAIMYSTNTYTLKENTSYEASAWIKTSNLYGFKFYIYEPVFTNRLNVSNVSYPSPWEGQNIYSFSYDGGADAANPPYRTTRVARTDISYTYRANSMVTENTGTGSASMAYLRGTATQLEKDTGVSDAAGVYFEPSLKYGAATNGWVKVTVTFKTKSGTWSYSGTGAGATDLPYSAPVTIGIGTRDQEIKANNISTLSVAELSIKEGYTITANVDTNNKGGMVSVNGATAGATSNSMIYAGQTATLTASPFTGNEFLGWYSGTTLLSSDLNYTFSPSVDATFTAKFKNNNLYDHPGFEDYTANYVLASGGPTSNPGDEVSVDGWRTGVSNWFKISAVASPDPIYSGARSIRIDHRYNDGACYEFAVTQNTNYVVNFKWYLPKDTSLGGTATYATRFLKIVAPNGTNNTNGTLLSASANNNLKGTGNWEDITLSFNSGSNTSVRLAMGADHASSAGADQLHIDDLYIFKTLTIGATSNNNGGAVTVSKTTALPGDSITFTAKAYDGNTFNGWYKDSVLYSTNPNLTQKVYADTSLEARFTDNNLIPEAGFETLPTTELFNNTTGINPTWSGSASWGSGSVVTTYASSGTKSLRVNERHNTTAKLITGLTPNTNYVFSMYYYIPVQHNAGHAFNYAAVTTSNYQYLTSSTGAIGEPDGINVFGKATPLTTTFGAWTKVSVPFNTGNNTDVKLQFRYATDGTTGELPYLFVDEMALYQCYNVTATRSGTGGIVTTPLVSVAPGGSATLVAVPNEGDTFLGWYLNDVKVSDDTTFVTPAISADTQFVAKFTSNTVTVNGNFENYANSTRLDNYVAPEVTTAPAANWKGTSVWYQNTQRFPASNYSWISATVTNVRAHSGSNSLALSGMFQGFYHEITDIAPNKTYTLSLYYWLPAWDDTNVPSFRHISVIPGTSQVDYNGNPLNYPNIPNPADRAFFETYNAADTANDLWQPALARLTPGTRGTGNWEQMTITFSSGSNTSVFLSLGYNALATSGYKMYIDDITLAVAPEILTDLDADTDPGKLVKNESNTTITEVDTTASEPAELGSKMYRVTTGANFQFAYGDTMVLKGGKQYDVSFWFKVADDHPILTTQETNLKYVSFFMQNVGTSIPIQSAFTLAREPIDGSKVTSLSQTTEFNLSNTSVVNGSGVPVWQKITASFTPVTDTTAVFAFRPNAAGTVYIDQIKVTSAENAIADVQAAISEVGTAIRTSGIQALRFKTSINKSAFENLYFGTYEMVEYGSIAIKTSYLNGEELVEGSYLQADGTTVRNTVKGAAYIKGQKNVIFADTGTAIHYTAALTGISQTNYNTAYSVRAYAVLARPDGSTFTVYDDATRSTTIYTIANLAYNAAGGNDGYAETPEVRNYLHTNIISKADFETFPGDGFKHVN